MAVSAIANTISIRVKPRCDLLRHIALNPTDAGNGFIGLFVNDFIGLQAKGKRLCLAQWGLELLPRTDIEARALQDRFHITIVVFQQREIRSEERRVGKEVKAWRAAY